MISGKTIFISPLDWGLGHATRCVPVIHSLLKNNTVILGITPINKFFFEIQFPQCQKIGLPSYQIQYSSFLPVWLAVLLQWPKINKVIKQERELLKEIVKQHKVDLVISDNRFGLWHPHVFSIFMSHQLSIAAPFLSFFANRVNRSHIHKFSEVWVPDYEERARRLSGNLSEGNKITIPIRYIGPQSYLQKQLILTKTEETIDYLILLSGIEPQRSLVEKILVEAFEHSDKKIVLVRGSQHLIPLAHPYIEVKEFSEGAELCRLIVSAGTVICRSGYSTLMDLHILAKKKLLLVPTPGQTEQEYLAQHWEKNFDASAVSQPELGAKIRSLLAR